MSGGFFRGTSADQDTRFSNKQAKLMKSQKFPAELEHLVDMTKVKMDLMKPWIAKRVTELIGFEDEVLINFIYSLLEKKVVNGKEVQISLTGFMERNTGKFMKELWALLLSAQGNASGVPQQFLEAKEEEMRKKKVETDRIADEIQKRKERENRELDEERRKKDDYARNSREKNATLEPSPEHHPRRRSTDDVDPVERNGSRGRNRASRSPRSADHSPLLRRSRSISKSFSNSRSHSRERRRSRSASFERRGRSLSSERENHSPPRRSVSPRRKPSPRRSFSPPRHRRRSTSRVRRRSPSPARYRRHSPFRRRSRSPIWRRSRSPMRRRSRSPMRRRSRSPMWRRSRSPRRRSPVRYISRSPVRRRSPPSIRHRTPSPAKRRSPSPASRGYRRSRLSPRRSPSPVQRKPSISGRKRSTTPVRRSLSPQESLSPSPIYRRSPSPIRKRVLKNERSPVQSPRGKTRSREKHSPVRQASPVQAEDHKGSSSLERRRPITSRSPQRDAYDRKDSRRKDSPLPPPQGRSPSILESPRRTRSDSESPPARRERSPSEGRGPRSTLNWRERKPIATDSPSPMKSNEHRVRSNISEKIADEKEKDNSREFEHKSRSSRKNPTVSDSNKNRGKGLDEEQYSEAPSHKDRLELRKRHEVIKSEKLSGRMEHIKDLNQQKSPATTQVHSNSGKKERELNVGESFKADKENLPHTNDTKGKELPVDQNDRSSNDDSGSEEGERHRAKNKDKRKHKRSDRYESSSDGSYESGVEDRKEAKRRRKEERRLKKEEKRRRREERRRKKEERRALKLKSKSGNAMSSPSDTEGNFDGRISDDERARKKGRNAPEIDGSESLQKRLEIELREKALESLRAKKGINH